MKEIVTSTAYQWCVVFVDDVDIFLYCFSCVYLCSDRMGLCKFYFYHKHT